ncbi:cytochrome P450 [Vineibacter terrae]|uniref:cytochrome P450 n=1 Tax=Vineibacter terrae TaxID=2586908 RepID=UPI002E3391B2|nr:cytochrome P450 [Vineibacter terrae]HEX2885939.1 cytochrome P450 [Vineibacter terrae]
MLPPADPIAAVTHADPYDYYAGLVARRPLYHDEALGMWVASGAASVTAVLGSARVGVRPLAETVPAALQGTPAGDIFGRLVRMNDGAGHCPFKQAVTATLQSIDEARVASLAEHWAHRLAGTQSLNEFMLALPVHVVGSLLGVADDAMPALAQDAGDFVRGIAPVADAAQRARGAVAAAALLALFHRMRAAQEKDGDGLLMRLAGTARGLGRADEAAVVANGIGFLSQAYEATAGLIGNTLVALARHHDARAQVAHDARHLRGVVWETLRADPPVQNTRRFVADDGVVAGQQMRRGDAILVVLAAAGRDPAANAEPARFDTARQDRRLFTFGAAVHACPGERIAAAIAQAGVARLLAGGVRPEALLQDLAYRPSGNVRMPLFAD